MRTTAGIAVLVMICELAFGETADPAITFEVASIRLAPPPDGRPRAVRSTGVPGSPYGTNRGRFTAENFSLPNLILVAYDIPYYRLSAPGLPFNVSFNIEAKMPIDTTKEQFQAMLRNLLAERFGLKVHWVTRQLAMYDLVVAKGGPKLKPATPDAPPETDNSDPRRTAFPGIQRGPDGFPIPPSRHLAIRDGWP